MCCLRCACIVCERCNSSSWTTRESTGALLEKCVSSPLRFPHLADAGLPQAVSLSHDLSISLLRLVDQGCAPDDQGVFPPSAQELLSRHSVAPPPKLQHLLTVQIELALSERFLDSSPPLQRTIGRSQSQPGAVFGCALSCCAECSASVLPSAPLVCFVC